MRFGTNSKNRCKPEALWVAALVLLVGHSAHAFDSFPKGNLHRKITEKALEDRRFSRYAARTIQSANYRLDRREVRVSVFKWLIPGGKGLVFPNRNYRPAHHFDRNQGETDLIAFRRGVAFVKTERETILRLACRKEPVAALGALGRALHALQDFFSHSNFVDLNAAQQRKVLGSLFARREPIDVPLRLTGYDSKRGKDPRGDSYGHDAFSKDNKNKNKEARAQLKSGRTKFAAAYAAAVEASKRFVSSLEDQLSEDEWKLLRTVKRR